jgi:hypothetical protein
MLENLESINWKDLKTSHGRTAEKVPEYIRQLTSTDPQVRKQALGHLEGAIYDDYLADSTPATVPFLIELLGSPAVWDKDAILFFLQGLTRKGYEQGTNERLKDYRMIKLWRWEKPVYEAVAAGLPAYLPLLYDPDWHIRFFAVALLGREARFPQSAAGQIADSLLRHIPSEAHPDVRIEAMVALGQFVAAYRDTLPEVSPYLDLVRPVMADSVPMLSLAAKLSVVAITGPDAPAELVEQLRQIMMNPPRDASTSKILKLGTYQSFVDMEVWRSLWYIGLERVLPLFQRMFEDVSSAKRARELAMALLMWVFYQQLYILEKVEKLEPAPDGSLMVKYRRSSKTTPIEELTAAQKQAVMVVVEADKVWETPHNLLEEFGLPADREELRGLLR